MTEKPDSDLKDIQNALDAYQAAIQLWTYEGQLIWSVFNALVLANTIVIGAYNFSSGDSPSKALSIIGLVICIIWLLLNHRGFEIQNYRVLSTCAIEEQYLSSITKVVSDGAKFHAGEKVQIKLQSKEQDDLQLRLVNFWILHIPYPKMLTAQRLSSVVIVIFGAVHAYFFFTS